MEIEVVTPPSSEPVTLAEAKWQCRVTSSSEDDKLNHLIGWAREEVEKFTGTKLVEQTVRITAKSWDDLARLPIGPLAAVSSILYLDEDGTERTLDSSVYETNLRGVVPEIRLKIGQSWPVVREVSDAIRVTVTAGYETLPVPIKRACLYAIGRAFDGEEDSGLDATFHRHLLNFRRHWE